jgi:3-oxoadipate enol-lactonase
LRLRTVAAVTGVHDREANGMAWRERGAGDVVVFLHGLGGSRISWEPQLGELSARYRCVAWDLPGYGASKPLAEPMTFAGLAQAVADFIETLGVDSAHLVGISFGGMIAQYTAAFHPERVRTLALVSSSPAFGLDGTKPDEWRAARLAPLDAGREPRDFAEVVLRSIAGPHISDVAMAGQRAAMERISADGLRRSIDCLITHDSRPFLHQIAAPTLCLVGESDEETPPSYASALTDGIQGARLEIIPNAGHLLNAEAPATVNALLSAHFEGAS